MARTAVEIHQDELYGEQKYGFVRGDSFADYVRSEFNQFLHLSL